VGVTPCSAGELYQTFGVKYCLHLHGLRVKLATSKEEAVNRESFGLLFDPEDESSKFLRNIEELLPDCIASAPRRYYTFVLFICILFNAVTSNSDYSVQLFDSNE
jgi:hypothetical protein